MLTHPKETRRARGPGRPREFDVEAALDKALSVFRERGYHATSLADLRAATKLTTGSLYKAFEDKRAIFLAAFERYTRRRNAALQERLDVERSGRDKLRAVLLFYAEASHGGDGRRGCLVASSATELATFDADMAAQVKAALRRLELLLRTLIRLGQSDGSVAPDTDRDAAAGALLCVLQGFRVVGKTGRTRSEMMAAANQALRMLA